MDDRDLRRLAPDDVLAGPACAWYPAGAGYGPRRLSDFELVWLLSGSARWESAGRPVMRLVPGDVLLAPPGSVDRFHWDDTRATRHGYAHFRLRRSGDGWPLIRTMTPADPLDGLLRYVLWLAGSPGADARARIADVLGVAVDLFVHGPWPGADEQGGWPAPLAGLAEAVADAWTAGMRPVRLDELASATGFSSGHLSRAFRARYGMSVIAGLERIRLGRAEVLLRRSDLTVAQIARLCGFADPLHFSRRFRAANGCSPRAFRDLRVSAAPGDIGSLRSFGNRVADLCGR